MSAVHTQRGFGGLAYLVVACGLGLYFTFAAVQGELLRRFGALGQSLDAPVAPEGAPR